MSDAQKMWDAAAAVAKAYFELPEVKAYYERVAKQQNDAWNAEQARLKRERAAAEADTQRKRSYDVWALNGGGDECTQFGIMDGCKPWCPVFERGQCSAQEENEEAFAARLLPTSNHAGPK